MMDGHTLSVNIITHTFFWILLLIMKYCYDRLCILYWNVIKVKIYLIYRIKTSNMFKLSNSKYCTCLYILIYRIYIYIYLWHWCSRGNLLTFSLFVSMKFMLNSNLMDRMHYTFIITLVIFYLASSFIVFVLRICFSLVLVYSIYNITKLCYVQCESTFIFHCSFIFR